MDYRQDPEAWADALLEEHRTGGRSSPEPEREATAPASQGPPTVRRPVDYRQDPEAWADALLDEHRTSRAGEAEREREAAADALQRLPRHVRWMLTHAGRESDPDVVVRLARGSERRARLERWETVLNFVSLGAVCALGLLLLSFL